MLLTTHLPTYSPECFDPNNPALQATAVRQGGRNAAWFIQFEGQEAVLKHYRRGGLIAKFISRRYVWLGAKRTRSVIEYIALQHLYDQGLAVPKPLAFYWQRHGLSYQAALIVARIPHALPIAQQLDTTSPQAVATAIYAMHNAGVWHADLNAFNILITPEQRVHLIDFDKAKIQNVVNSKQRQNNLLRLRRSLIKVRGEAGLAWFQQLQNAYFSFST